MAKRATPSLRMRSVHRIMRTSDVTPIFRTGPISRTCCLGISASEPASTGRFPDTCSDLPASISQTRGLQSRRERPFTPKALIVVGAQGVVSKHAHHGIELSQFYLGNGSGRKVVNKAIGVAVHHQPAIGAFQVLAGSIPCHAEKRVVIVKIVIGPGRTTVRRRQTPHLHQTDPVSDIAEISIE